MKSSFLPRLRSTPRSTQPKPASDRPEARTASTSRPSDFPGGLTPRPAAEGAERHLLRELMHQERPSELTTASRPSLRTLMGQERPSSLTGRPSLLDLMNQERPSALTAIVQPPAAPPPSPAGSPGATPAPQPQADAPPHHEPAPQAPARSVVYRGKPLPRSVGAATAHAVTHVARAAQQALKPTRANDLLRRATGTYITPALRASRQQAAAAAAPTAAATPHMGLVPVDKPATHKARAGGADYTVYSRNNDYGKPPTGPLLAESPDFRTTGPWLAGPFDPTLTSVQTVQAMLAAMVDPERPEKTGGTLGFAEDRSARRPPNAHAQGRGSTQRHAISLGMRPPSFETLAAGTAGIDGKALAAARGDTVSQRAAAAAPREDAPALPVHDAMQLAQMDQWKARRTAQIADWAVHQASNYLEIGEAHLAAARAFEAAPPPGTDPRAVAQARRDVDTLDAAVTAMQDRLALLRADRADAQQAQTAADQVRAARAAEHSAIEREALPGFADPAAQGALRTALAGLHERVAASVAGKSGVTQLRALPPESMQTMTLKALALATGGDGAAAADALRELGGRTLQQLTQDAQALSPAARRTAQVLAKLPRGLEMLQHLTQAPPAGLDAKDAARQRQGAKIFLQADARLAQLGPRTPANAIDHDFASAAREAGRLAAASNEPARTLEEICTPQQRAAYHAFRNGMESKAPDSPYDQVRLRIVKLGKHLRQADILPEHTHPVARQAARLARGAPVTGRSPFHALPISNKPLESANTPTARTEAGRNLVRSARDLRQGLSALDAQGDAALTGAAVLGRALLERIANSDDYRYNARDERVTAALVKDIRKRSADALPNATAAGPATATQAVYERLWQAATAARPVSFAQLLSSVREQVEALSDPGEAAQRTPTQQRLASAVQLLDTAVVQSQVRAKDPLTPEKIFDHHKSVIQYGAKRTRLGLSETTTVGLNTGTGVGVGVVPGVVTITPKAILGYDHSKEVVSEFYHDSTTGQRYKSVSRETDSFQVGAGFTVSGAIGVEGKGRLRAAVEGKYKHDRFTEQGFGIQMPRVSSENAQRADEFLLAVSDLFQHAPDAGPDDDVLETLLARSPHLSVGRMVAQGSSHAGSLSASLGFSQAFRDLDGGLDKRGSMLIGGQLKYGFEKAKQKSEAEGAVRWVTTDATVTSKASVAAGVVGTAAPYYDSVQGSSGGTGSTATGSNATTVTSFASPGDLAWSLQWGDDKTKNLVDMSIREGEYDWDWSSLSTEYRSGADALDTLARTRLHWIGNQIEERLSDADLPWTDAQKVELADKHVADFHGLVADTTAKNSTASVTIQWSVTPALESQIEVLRGKVLLAEMEEAQLLERTAAGPDAQAQAQARLGDLYREVEQHNADLVTLLADPQLRMPASCHLSEKPSISKAIGIEWLGKARATRTARAQAFISQMPTASAIPKPIRPLTPGFEPRDNFRRDADYNAAQALLASLGHAGPALSRLEMRDALAAALRDDAFDRDEQGQVSDRGQRQRATAAELHEALHADVTRTHAQAEEPAPSEASASSLYATPRSTPTTSSGSSGYATPRSSFASPERTPAPPQRPTVPRGVPLPAVREVAGDAQARAALRAAEASYRDLLPAVAQLMASSVQAPSAEALAAMSPREVHAALQAHAADSFIAYAEHGGEPPDLATASRALLQITNLRLTLEGAVAVAAQGPAPSALLRDLTAMDQGGAIGPEALERHFDIGQSSGTGNACMFDTVFQLAQRAGHGERLQPFGASATQAPTRAGFAARVQALFEQTGLLPTLAAGGHAQLEFEPGSMEIGLLARLAGVRLVSLTEAGPGFALGPPIGGEGPEAFLLRRPAGAGGGGHFEPLWPKLQAGG